MTPDPQKALNAMDRSFEGGEVEVYSRLGVEIVEGDGVRVRTRDGRWLIDFYGGHAVALLGYRHPRILKTLAEQAERLFFQTNAVDLEVRAIAARKLAGIAPRGLHRVFLVNTGTEANENALRVAFLMTGRSKVVALSGSFHGRTAASAACTHGAEAKWYGFPRTPFDVEFVPPGEIAALENALTGQVAALIVEPVQGVAGAAEVPLPYLRRARELTSARGIFLIADEVQCGMGRSGHYFAIEAAQVVPDLLTTAKGLAAGFPAGAVLMSTDTSRRLEIGSLGTTFGGGPMACALIAVVVEELKKPGFLERVRRTSDLIRSRCLVGPVRAIQGRGLLLGLRMSGPAIPFLNKLLDRGILAGGSADPEIIRLMPPLILEESHVEALRTALLAL